MPSVITNFSLDSLTKTAHLNIIPGDGATFFKFENDEFLLEARTGATVPGTVVAPLVIDIMRWFLLVLEEIGFDDFGVQSPATTESNRIVGGDINFERSIDTEKAFEGTHDISENELTIEPRDEFLLNPADFAALVMFYVNLAKKVGIAETELSSILLLESRIRASIPFPVV